MEELLSSTSAVSGLRAGPKKGRENDTGDGNIADEPCVHQLVEQQAERTPDALAVADCHQQLTYRELNERAECLARQLAQLGVTMEVPVAVCLERSVELVVALLAVLKAGGAYLPLEPAHPRERHEFMLKDAAAPVLIVAESVRPSWATQVPFCHIVAVEASIARLGQSGDLSPACAWLNPVVQSHHLAYVIYTSGSTGKPKGVQVEHGSLSNLVLWHQQTYALTSGDRATLVASPAFDASTWELWPYLAAGASIHIPAEAVRRSPARLVDWLNANQITLTFAPTPLAEAMLEHAWPERCSLRAFFTGGDRLRRGAPKDFPCVLANHYGPTEATVVTTALCLDSSYEGHAPPIGRPIRNTQVYVLDGAQKPVPVGVPGELYIGGAGVARGYLNRPELTAERFIPDPFTAEPGARLYRTGDLVCWRPDGSLDFLGRTDDQVKIRGHRLEPGEIEATLRTLPAIRDAVVLAWKSDHASGEPALVAYVTSRAAHPLLVEELRAYLKSKLPEYMVPTAFVLLDELPMTTNGKLDRRALPAPPCQACRDFIPPRTATEQVLAAIWRELLNREEVSVQDNFFHLGGHSLLAARMLSRVRHAFQLELELTAVFDAPTLETLASAVDNALARQQDAAHHDAMVPPPSLVPWPRNDDMPGNPNVRSKRPALSLSKAPPLGIAANGSLHSSDRGRNGAAHILVHPCPGHEQAKELSFAQERLWFLEQLEPGVPFNNVPIALRARGRLNARALEQALAEVVRRHEPLHSVFRDNHGQPITLPQSPSFAMLVFDLSAVPAEERQAEARRLVTVEARCRFDLTQNVLLRVKLIRLAADDYLMVLVTHHIACDGWSLAVFYRELSVLYEAFMQKRPGPLPALPIGYGDFASWQRRSVQGGVLEKQLLYWQNQLADAPTALMLPAARPRPPVQTYRGAAHYFSLGSSSVTELSALCQREEVTIFMLLLAAWQTLLHRYSGQEDILVGSPLAGRAHLETESLIGIFLNMLVLRGDLSGDPTFCGLLKRIRQVALAAYEHQDLPFEKLVDVLQPKRDLSRSPLFQVMFVWHNEPSELPKLAGLELESIPLHNGTARFDLTLSLEPRGDSVAGYIEYNTDLFEQTTVVRMAGHFQTLLEGIIANPNERLSALPLLTEGERAQLLANSFGPQIDIAPQCIHECFEEQVQRTPHAVALVFGDQQLTYRELDQHATALAEHLHRLGVGPGACVGVCMTRSLEMLVGLLGIHKAGGAYLPLDPSYPKERLAFMLEDARVQWLVTSEPTALPSDISGLGPTAMPLMCLEVRLLPDSTGALVLKLSSRPDNVGHTPLRSTPCAGLTREPLAYLIYTSGSTGKPKGVLVTHRNVLNFFTAMDRLLGRQPGVWLAVTSISFDISVLELFWTLTRGYKVILHRSLGAGQGARRFESRSTRLSGNGLTSIPTRGAHARKMDFSLFYFATDAREGGPRQYRLLVEGAKFADAHGFKAVWTPERHFHAFGGLYPNPSVAGAALAMVTNRIRLRAGSVVLPLHDPIRVAEEWALVDNLCGGRVDISFASGWHADDFVLCPQNYAERQAVLLRDIDMVRRLWRGESVMRRNGAGQTVEVRVLPRPVQAELPFWITAAGNPETFRKAGQLGANLLTHLLGQSIEELTAKLALYRAAWTQAGHPGQGQVTLMLHTFVGTDTAEVYETVRAPFSEYLKSSLDLLTKSSSVRLDPKQMTPDDIDATIARVLPRYLENSGLFGTPAVCAQRVEPLQQLGVDELACLIDFGVNADAVMNSLALLDQVREQSNQPQPSLRSAHERASPDPSPTEPGFELKTFVETRSRDEPRSISEEILHHGVTHLQCTPSLMTMLLQEPLRVAQSGACPELVAGPLGELGSTESRPTLLKNHDRPDGGGARLRRAEGPLAQEALASLRVLLLGGEALPMNLARQLKSCVRGEMFNLYGPTETTIWSAAHKIEDVSRAIPIGHPLANTEIHIVDRRGCLVPIGVPGELLIGGAGVTRGYLERPELTAEKFIRHPFSADSEARLYRTGDLARYGENGELEFLGRIDQQVKIHGHRIEPGEIEGVLGQHPAVEEAVVTAWGDTPDQQHLVAYVVPRRTTRDAKDNATKESVLREYLKQHLPDHMVPTAIVLLEAFPLTANGKVDRRSLPSPDASRLASPKAFVAPGTETQQLLARIWSDVLGLKQIGADDDFFDLGGHSLLIMQVLARIRDTFQVELRMRRFFDAPTIAGLAATIEELLWQEINELPEKEADRLAATPTRSPIRVG
jgi:natural product biosynthesis luciferase-like monooxygenase protein/amino acid adenylation domain-containing protein